MFVGSAATKWSTHCQFVSSILSVAACHMGCMHSGWTNEDWRLMELKKKYNCAHAWALVGLPPRAQFMPPEAWWQGIPLQYWAVQVQLTLPGWKWNADETWINLNSYMLIINVQSALQLRSFNCSQEKNQRSKFRKYHTTENPAFDQLTQIGHSCCCCCQCPASSFKQLQRTTIYRHRWSPDMALCHRNKPASSHWHVQESQHEDTDDEVHALHQPVYIKPLLYNSTSVKLTRLQGKKIKYNKERN